jgi:Recombination endonuclease VII
MNTRPRICPMCGKEKPWTDYVSANGNSKYGYCQDCRRTYQSSYQNARRTAEQRNAPKACEICGLTFNEFDTAHFDHDHNTGLFRGWLCKACNMAIDQLRNSPEIARKAAVYLERPPQVIEETHEERLKRVLQIAESLKKGAIT